MERSSPRTLVICPMEIESDAVRRAAQEADSAGLHLVRSGIGKDAIVSVLERELDAAPTALAILAGVCGALTAVDDVPSIARIIDEHGTAWHGARGMHPRGVTLIAVDRIVSTPADKRRLAESSGASIVDMESHAFAAACVRRGVEWSVVRGVSDTPEETLPERVLHWIRPDGTTRTGRAVVDLLSRPWLVPHVVGALRRARRVMPAVGRRVIELHAEVIGSARTAQTASSES